MGIRLKIPAVIITKDHVLQTFLRFLVRGYGQTRSKTKPRNTLSAVSGSKLDAIGFRQTHHLRGLLGESCFINVREEHG